MQLASVHGPMLGEPGVVIEEFVAFVYVPVPLWLAVVVGPLPPLIVTVATEPAAEIDEFVNVRFAPIVRPVILPIVYESLAEHAPPLVSPMIIVPPDESTQILIPLPEALTFWLYVIRIWSVGAILLLPEMFVSATVFGHRPTRTAVAFALPAGEYQPPIACAAATW